ncbi:MAG: chromate transporter, partial [Paludibacteraceae bacterium]|nr:chromate transporter [Paludibacteraceae bacterium]
MIYLQLFLSFFKIGLFGFGGGMAIFSLIQMEVVQNGWLTPEEIVDIMAISQVTPGPIGINCATYVGYTIGGFWGSVLTTSAIILPSLIIMLSICKAYFWLNKRFQGNPYFEQTLRMLRFAVIGLIASAALMLMKPTTFIDSTSWIIFAVVCIFTVLPNFIKQKEEK